MGGSSGPRSGPAMEITQFPSDGLGISEMILKVFRHSPGVLPRPREQRPLQPTQRELHLLARRTPSPKGWVVNSFMVSACLSASCLMSSLIKPKPKVLICLIRSFRSSLLRQVLCRAFHVMCSPMSSTILFRHGWCLIAGPSKVAVVQCL
ncbi:hypothetical protein HKI87_05g36590 [Chloropicon roscoffensis]|uniref:Uncharacterized protein n=1 Tax=Chloropicon roscoffensis TaxID=1461544 RepID=A0AAX4P7P6_9CHLO